MYSTVEIRNLNLASSILIGIYIFKSRLRGIFFSLLCMVEGIVLFACFKADKQELVIFITRLCMLQVRYNKDISVHGTYICSF